MLLVVTAVEVESKLEVRKLLQSVSMTFSKRSVA